MTHELDFSDLALVEISFSYSGRDYILREATGDAACQYRNALLKCTKLGPEGKAASIIGMADVEPLLVSLCVREIVADKEIPVSVAAVRSWPARMQKRLFKKVQEVSELDETGETLGELKKEREDLSKRIKRLEEDAVKNELESTEIG